jgi:hypothetical protein
MATHQLPTLTTDNDALWERLLAAFDGSAENYRAWLRQQLAVYVLDFEVNQQINVRRSQIIDNINVMT